MEERGMIAFESDSLEKAVEIAHNDPFVSQGLLESKWIKEWVMEI